MPARPLVDMGELAPYAGPEQIATLRPEARALHVIWDDGRKSRFHWTWLRDHCACSECRHPQTRERLFELHDLALPIGQAQAELEESGALGLTWPALEGAPAHRSRFDPGWLRRRAYDSLSRSERARPRQVWTAQSLGEVPKFHYGHFQDSTDVQRSWVEALLAYGVVLLRGGPARAGELERFATGIAPIHETHFGRIFDVQSKPDPNNAAYTSLALEPHVDLPNHPHPPDIQLLYCIANEADGGDSTLVDGLQVAERLREAQPEAFETLTTLAIDFRFQDAEVDIRHRVPLIELDSQGAVVGLRFNNWIRDSLDLPEGEVERFYSAYQQLWRALRHPDNQLRLRLSAGDVLAFDNRRVLHGRTAFTANGRRHLQGCYLPRSMVESRLRLLQREPD